MLFQENVQEITQGFLFKQISKIRLFDELSRVASAKKINLGFDSEHLPDKNWLTNILFNLDDKNQLFAIIHDSEGVIGLTRDDLNLIKELDTSMARKKILKFFRRTPDQIQKTKVLKANKKLDIVKRNLSKKKEESDKIEQQIRHFQIKIQKLQPQQDESQFQKKQHKL